MNGSLSCGGRRRRSPDPGRESGPSGLVPGPGRLVGGTAAARSDPRVGSHCATVGPRSLLRCWVGVSAKAAVNALGSALRDATVRPAGFKGIKHGGFARFLARNTMRSCRISKRKRTPMFLIDSRGNRPVCLACHRIGPYQQAAPRVFICEDCEQAADAHLQELAEAVPELRDHRLRRWRTGCDCDRCRRRGDRAV
jgi:hypothetical protein